MLLCFPSLVHGYGHNPLILPYIFQANTFVDNAQDQQWLSHPQGELVNALDNQTSPLATTVVPGQYVDDVEHLHWLLHHVGCQTYHQLCQVQTSQP